MGDWSKLPYGGAPYGTRRGWGGWCVTDQFGSTIKVFEGPGAQLKAIEYQNNRNRMWRADQFDRIRDKGR